MSERRRFLKTLAAGPAGALLLPLFSQTGRETMAADVENVADVLGRLPENIIYTKEKQGVWEGKAGGHVPLVDVKKAGDSLVLNVETSHGMSEEHYIVRHTIVNACGQVLGAKTFHWKDDPVSEHKIELPPGDKCKQLFVMSYCNLHDLWLLHTELDV